MLGNSDPLEDVVLEVLIVLLKMILFFKEFFFFFLENMELIIVKR